METCLRNRMSPDICLDSVASLMWPCELISGIVVPGPKIALGEPFELKLIDGKRWIFAGLRVKVRTSA
jgi:hypothetical protein